MLKDRKTRESAESFVEQWLGTRELGRNVKPDRTANPLYQRAGMGAQAGAGAVLSVHAGREPPAARSARRELHVPRFEARSGTIGLQRQRHEAAAQAVRPAGGEPSRRAAGNGAACWRSRRCRTAPARCCAASGCGRRCWAARRRRRRPNVPQLDEKQAAAAPQTIRELLEQHRAEPDCASCHNQIDPIGFGLENYDLLGRWRTEEAGKPIDAKGELPDGTKFDGPQELKQVLLERKDEFVRHLTTKMLGYALGRGLTIEDRCTVDEIVKKVKEGEYRSHVLIAEIVCSVPFRYRAADGAPQCPPPQLPSAKGDRHEVLRLSDQPANDAPRRRGDAGPALAGGDAAPRAALAAAAAAKPPVRMAVLYMPNGVNPRQVDARRRRPRLPALADAGAAGRSEGRRARRSRTSGTGAARPPKGTTSRRPASSPARRSPRPTASI